MSFADDLQKARQQAPQQPQPQMPQQPGEFAGPAPRTQEEVELIRAQMAQQKQEEAFNRNRVESLSATVYARMMGGWEIIDRCCTVDDTGNVNIDTKLMQQYFAVANYISGEAAVAHANQVWGIPCERKGPSAQQPAQQAPPVPHLVQAEPQQAVPPAGSPAQQPAQEAG